MGDKEKIASYIKEGDWETELPPNKEEITRNVDTSKRTIENHQDKLRRNYGIEWEKIGGENRYAPSSYDWKEMRTQDKLKVKELLKKMFLEDLRSINYSKALDRKVESWKKGKVEEDKIREITAKITGKTLNDVRNDILDVVVSTAEEAEDERKEEIRREKERIKSKNTEEVTIEELSITLETHLWGAIFAFYRCPNENVRQGFENIKKGRYDDLLKKGVAKERELKTDSEVFEEKFTKGKANALDDLKENIENEDIHRPMKRPITREVDERENLIGTYLWWVMKEKLRGESKEILDQWEKNNIDWEELQEKTENIIENQWKTKPKDEIFQEKFSSIKEDVLEFALEKFS